MENNNVFSSSLRGVVSSKLWVNCITALILLNSIVLGMETYPSLMSHYGEILIFIDKSILWIFVGELVLRFLAYRLQFFTSAWSIFDLLVVSIAFMPANEAFSVLRTARVLRVLRLVSIFPKLKRVAEGLIKAIPGIGAIGAIMSIIIYVFAVMATKLYGLAYPEWFGSLHLSVFSLFQIMTLEGWPDIVRTVMKNNPYAWIFFVTYILVATFSVLNLFIAVIVDAMQKQHVSDDDDSDEMLRVLNKKMDYLIQKYNGNIDFNIEKNKD